MLEKSTLAENVFLKFMISFERLSPGLLSESNHLLQIPQKLISDHPLPISPPSHSFSNCIAQSVYAIRASCTRPLTSQRPETVASWLSAFCRKEIVQESSVCILAPVNSYVISTQRPRVLWSQFSLSQRLPLVAKEFFLLKKDWGKRSKGHRA